MRAKNYNKCRNLQMYDTEKIFYKCKIYNRRIYKKQSKTKQLTDKLQPCGLCEFDDYKNYLE